MKLVQSCTLLLLVCFMQDTSLCTPIVEIPLEITSIFLDKTSYVRRSTIALNGFPGWTDQVEYEMIDGDSRHKRVLLGMSDFSLVEDFEHRHTVLNAKIFLFSRTQNDSFGAYRLLHTDWDEQDDWGDLDIGNAFTEGIDYDPTTVIQESSGPNLHVVDVTNDITNWLLDEPFHGWMIKEIDDPNQSSFYGSFFTEDSTNSILWPRITMLGRDKRGDTWPEGGDGLWTPEDLDAIGVSIYTGEEHSQFNDTNEDNVVDIADAEQLLDNLGHYEIGDINFDWAVNELDSSIIHQHLFTENRVYSEGDLNFDGVIDGQDINIYNHNKSRFSFVVPEPVCFKLLVCGVLTYLWTRHITRMGLVTCKKNDKPSLVLVPSQPLERTTLCRFTTPLTLFEDSSSISQMPAS